MTLEAAVEAASHYERLRLAALGEPIAPHYRSGLILLLRRGMWSWACNRSTAVSPRQSTPPPPMHASASDHSLVIQLLAAMALHFNLESAT